MNLFKPRVKFTRERERGKWWSLQERFTESTNDEIRHQDANENHQLLFCTGPAAATANKRGTCTHQRLIYIETHTPKITERFVRAPRGRIVHPTFNTHVCTRPAHPDKKFIFLAAHSSKIWPGFFHRVRRFPRAANNWFNWNQHSAGRRNRVYKKCTRNS